MRLIIIYGPPASGKLTVAKELSKIIGDRVLHNHLTSDLLREVLDFGTRDFFEMSSKIRMMLFGVAAKKGVNLIFTVCYVPKFDNIFIKNIVKLIKEYKGKVYFVHLTCDKSELKNRVVQKSRKNFKKINSITGMNDTLKKHDFYTSIPFVDSYKINNTKVSAKKAALMIKEHFKL